MNAGSSIGAYDLESTMGRFGPLQVWRARHRVDGRVVRVSVCQIPEAHRARVTQAFGRRMLAVNQLHGPQIHHLTDSGVSAEGLPYLVDTLPGGEHLGTRLQQRRMKPDEVLDICVELLRALAEAHEFEIAHGALSPARVIFEPVRTIEGTSDQVRLLDLGVCHALQLPAQEGRFRAPELKGNAQGTAAADLYALGVLVGTMLLGAPPVTDQAEFPNAHPELAKALAAWLSANPAQRGVAFTWRDTLLPLRAQAPAMTPAPSAEGDSSWFGEDWDGGVPAAKAASPAPVPQEGTPAPAGDWGNSTPKPPQRASKGEKTNLVPIAAGVVVAALLAIGASQLFRGDGAEVEADAGAGKAALEALLESEKKPPKPPPKADAAPMEAPTTLGSPDAGADALKLEKRKSVLVVVDPAPARFINVDTEKVICEREESCRVGLEHVVRIERKGAIDHTLSPDDLFDRRGRTWKVLLQPEPEKRKRRRRRRKR